MPPRKHVKKSASKPKKKLTEAEKLAQKLAEEEEMPDNGYSIDAAEPGEKDEEAKEEPKEEVKEEETKVVPFTGKEATIDPNLEREAVPYIKDQMNQKPDTCWLSRVMTISCDMLDKQGIADHDKWLTKCLDPDTGYELANVDEFNNSNDKFIRLLQISVFRFKNPLVGAIKK